MSNAPLTGLRVLAVEQYGAGPFGTSYLADLGAEVVKIENHKEGGDVGRAVGPHFFGPGDSQFFQTFNRNKKSVTLDLKHADGKAAFRALAKGADAALENSIESMRIHGAYGYSKEYDIERLYRDAPLTCIGEGTNEMQRIIIAKQWIKRNPVA